MSGPGLISGRSEDAVDPADFSGIPGQKWRDRLRTRLHFETELALGLRTMINRTESPVGWANLLSDLEDAHEHLGNLMKEIAADVEYGEPEFRIDLGHVYAHLNRAWHRRLIVEDFTETQWAAAGSFPNDIEPVA